jgi:DNA-binding SARP family transcriptional activator
MSRLTLAVLGQPRVTHGSHAVAFPTRKALALLVYLAVEGGAHSREKISALFWPESDSPAGRATLRKTLAYLHQALNEPQEAHLVAARDSLAVDASDITLDLWEIQSVLDRPHASLENLQAVAALCRGDFLEGFSLRDCPAFDDWAGVQGEIWHRKIGEVLGRLAAMQAGSGQPARAIETAARWVAYDPLNEAAHRRLIELHAAHGDRAAALVAYDACRATLLRELATEPSPETQALAQRVRAQRLSAPLPPPQSMPEPASATPAGEVALLGRASEQQAMVSAFRLARQGQLQVIAIAGEPGIGKTRLAREFLGWAGMQGVVTLEGRSFEAGGRLAYQPIVEALRGWLEQAADPRGLLADSWWAELSRILPELAERWSDLPAPAATGESESRTKLLEAVVRLGQALAAAAPVVWFLDDLQWADPASLELVQYALRRWGSARVPQMLILTLRSEDLATTPALAEWLAGLPQDVGRTRLTLACLTLDDTRQLAWAIGLGAQDSRAGLPSGFSAFSQQLFAETAGQPFFVVQTLRSLTERGLLSRNAEGEWTANLDREIPGSIKELIRSRLGHLSALAQTLCATGAVLGDGFEYALLCEVAEVDPAGGLAAYELLLARGLLREAGGRCFFTHDRIREVAYGDLSDVRRRMLHRRAITALEGARAPASSLVPHALAAGVDERARQLSLAAGEEAMRVSAVRNAIGHFALAEQLAARAASPPDVTATRHLYIQLGRAHELNNDREAARQVYDRMLSAANRLGDAWMECVALNRLATLAAQVHDYGRATELLGHAHQVAESSGDKVGLAETEWSLAQLGIYLQDAPAAYTHGRQALALARETDQADLTARSLNVLAFAELGLGEIEGVIAHGREASARYARLGQPAMQADSTKLVAYGLMRDGRLAEGLTLAREALALCEQIDDVWGAGSCLLHVACGLADQGQYSEAQRVIARAQSVAGDTPFVPWLLGAVLGATYRAMLDIESALRLHSELWQGAARQALPGGVQAMLAAELCADCVAASDWARAADLARQACAQRGYGALPAGHSLWPETLALTRSGDLALATDEVTRYAARLGKFRRDHVQLLRAQAVLANARGETAQAHALLREAVALAEAIGLPGDLWQLYALLGDSQKAAAATRAVAANLDAGHGRTLFLAQAALQLSPTPKIEARD